jgi:hypothetical protein
MALTQVDGGLLSPTNGQFYSMKNRIINGAMVIDQRNAGASVTATGGGYTLDRWVSGSSQTSKYTVQQNAGSVTPPVGFKNYLGVTSSSAYSILTGDYFFQEQDIEGLNVYDLAWGTSDAKTVTLSFWVRSSLTGTFGGALSNNGQTRSYPFTYTISAANTWEQKSITIAGDTTGTWLITNGVGIRVYLGLGVGSTYSGTAGSWSGSTYVSVTGATSVVGTNGATFYITGVQLEKGSTATSFDYRPYGTELQLCQRYFYRVYDQQNTGGSTATTSVANTRYAFPVTMRSAPTPSFITTGSWIVGNDYSANYTATTATISAYAYSVQGGRIGIGGFGGTLPAAGSFVGGSDATGTAVLGLSAEL